MDPAPTVEMIKRTTKIYPYAQGGFGTSVATLLEGDVPPRPAAAIPETVFVEGEREGVQHDPAERLRLLRAAERAGAGRAGGQHGHRADGPVGRDRDRQGQAVHARRADAAHPRGRGRRRQRDLAGAGLRSARVGRVRVLRRLGVGQHAVGRRLQLRDAAAAGHRGGDQAASPDRRPGAGCPNLRFLRLHRVTPAMCMRLTGIGSQYIVAFKDANGNPLDGAQDLPGDPAAGHPGGAVLVAHRLRQRDALDAADTAALPARRKPVLPDPRGDRGRRRLDDRHVRPGAARRQPGGQLDPDRPSKGWFVILRLYSPLQPFFDKTWRPSEIEPMSAAMGWHDNGGGAR